MKLTSVILALGLSLAGVLSVVSADQSSDSREDGEYDRGTAALDKRDWEEAMAAYQAVIAHKGSRTDGALYWEAYALNKLGRRTDALNTIARLQSQYPNSHWINDAKALEMDVRQSEGQKPRPESQSDDDLKLMAISALMNSGSDRALPLLEKTLQGTSSLKVKERALFVLAQSGSPKAQEILVRIAKGNSNPDLQLKAIDYLGIFGKSENRQLLTDLYSSSSDPRVRGKILQSFMVMGDRGAIFAVAKSESNPTLRRKSVDLLGALHASAELEQLYAAESSPDLKRSIVNGLFICGDLSALLKIAKSSDEPSIRREAVQKLGLFPASQSADALVSIYSTEHDLAFRQEVVNGLFIQQNASKLIDLARKETDPAMKRRIVERLSLMRSKEATDYMIEILNKD